MLDRAADNAWLLDRVARSRICSFHTRKSDGETLERKMREALWSRKERKGKIESDHGYDGETLERERGFGVGRTSFFLYFFGKDEEERDDEE